MRNNKKIYSRITRDNKSIIVDQDGTEVDICTIPDNEIIHQIVDIDGVKTCIDQHGNYLGRNFIEEWTIGPCCLKAESKVIDGEIKTVITDYETGEIIIEDDV